MGVRYSMHSVDIDRISRMSRKISILSGDNMDSQVVLFTLLAGESIPTTTYSDIDQIIYVIDGHVILSAGTQGHPLYGKTIAEIPHTTKHTITGAQTDRPSRVLSFFSKRVYYEGTEREGIEHGKESNQTVYHRNVNSLLNEGLYLKVVNLEQMKQLHMTAQSTLMNVKPGEGIQFESHRSADQVTYVISGKIQAITHPHDNGHDMEIFNQGDVVFIPKGYHHGFRNIFTEPVTLLNMYSNIVHEQNEESAPKHHSHSTMHTKHY